MTNGSRSVLARRALLTVALALLTLGAAACSGMPATTASPTPDRPDSSLPTAGTQPRPTTPGPPVEGPRELQFTAPALGGGTIRGAAYAGQDLVMWFWAPW